MKLHNMFKKTGEKITIDSLTKQKQAGSAGRTFEEMQ